MDAGSLYVLHGAALCLHAAWSHCSYIAARVKLVGVLGAVSRDCVTSVRSYKELRGRAVSSRVFLAFTLRGLPELAARGFLVYFENRV